MKPRDSGQDFDPKHRIIGAIVVVALAVILIPMVLDGGEPPAEPAASQAASPTEAGAEANKVVVTKVTPLGAAPGPENSAPAAAEVKSAVTAPARQPTAPPPAKPRTEAKAPVQAPPSSGWVVQVGTFANAANATRLERKLRAGGQAVLAERIRFEGSNAVRLRVGPFRDRAAALRAQERIQKDVGVKGVVLAYP